MKGIILAGGTGTRLLPTTSYVSKQLLPVYDRPMIFYPLNTLIKAGIKDILVIVAPENSGDFLNLLGSMFRRHRIDISFVVQKSPRGLADAFILGADFLENGPGTLILGDNIFEDDFTEAITSFKKGGRIFAREVADPERFGVVEFDQNGKAVSIEEKPKSPKSRYAIPGLYIFDQRVAEIARDLKPSARGELEIVDLHNAYLKEGALDVRIIEGAWYDAGTPDSLLEAGRFAKEKNLAARFDPLLNEAIAEFSEEWRTRKSLKEFKRT